jgi:tetratricopeptide (TPR) repeat protein
MNKLYLVLFLIVNNFLSFSQNNNINCWTSSGDISDYNFNKAEFEKAIDDTILGIKFDANDLNTYINKSISYMAENNFEEAVKITNKYILEFIESYPDEIEGINGRGQVRIIKKNYKEAANDFKTVLKHDPNNFGAINNLIYVYLKLNDKIGVCETYQKFIQLGNPQKIELELYCK